MKVMFTGASGFIGRPLLGLLLNSGVDVFTVGRGNTEESCRHHKLDLMDSDGLRTICRQERPTHLVHLAWYTEHGKFWSSPNNFAWFMATNVLIEEFIKAGGQHVSVAGTCAEYGATESKFITESHEANPSTTYGMCKHLSHLMTRQEVDRAGVKLAWLRVFFPFGGDDHSDRLIPTLHKINAGFAKPISVDKSSVRDFIHVNDIATAFKCSLLGELDGIYNVCSGTPVFIGDLIEAVAACYANPVQISSSDEAQPIKRLVGDPSRLRQEGWLLDFDVLKHQSSCMLA